MGEKSYRDQAWESRITSLENRLAGMGRGAFDEARDNERTRIELAGRIATLETQGTPADELASAVRDRLNQVEGRISRLEIAPMEQDWEGVLARLNQVEARLSRQDTAADLIRTRLDDVGRDYWHERGTEARLFFDLVQAGATSADATAIVIAWMQKETR